MGPSDPQDSPSGHLPAHWLSYKLQTWFLCSLKLNIFNNYVSHYENVKLPGAWKSRITFVTQYEINTHYVKFSKLAWWFCTLTDKIPLSHWLAEKFQWLTVILLVYWILQEFLCLIRLTGLQSCWLALAIWSVYWCIFEIWWKFGQHLAADLLF